MRFTVIGTDAAGNAVELTLDAMNADHAEHLALKADLRPQRVTVAPADAHLGPKQIGAAHAPAVAAAAPPNPAPVSPKPAPARVVTPFERSRKLGLLALGLGSLGFVLCWIPVIGLVGAPICLTGAVAGLLGVFIARSQYLPTGSWGRSVIPMTGAVVSSVALCTAVAVALVPTDDARASAEPRLAPIPVHTGSAPVADPERRRLSVVASSPAATPASILSPAPAPRRDAVADVPAVPVRLGTTEVSLVSARIENVQLMADFGRVHGVSPEPLLVIKVAIRNVGAEAVEYRTFAGDDGDLDARASALIEASGRRFRRGQFGTHLTPVGRVQTDLIYPGKQITDVLIFDAPPLEAMETMTLTLNGKCIGDPGVAEMTISPGLVTR